MEFGMFMEFQTRLNTPASAAFTEGLDLVDAAEAWGLDCAWLAEFHFTAFDTLVSHRRRSSYCRSNQTVTDRHGGIRAAFE